jgi:nucleotide-binding universal stress UspA family protein
VVDYPPVVTGEGMVPPNPEVIRSAAQEQLDRLAAPRDDVRAEHRLAEGDAAAEIVRVADEIKADLVVMGTHGRTGLGRLLMGSVAEQVVRKAPCPVLTLTTPFGASISPAADEESAGTASV